MIVSYKKRVVHLLASFLLMTSCLAPMAVSATSVVIPATKCVTAATVKLKTAAVTQMEKDVAPHMEKGDEAMLKVIEIYRQVLATAWVAMEEPYCGYGAYGSKSAVKSYSKSVLRARAAFLVQSKKVLAGQSVTTAAPVAPVSVTRTTEDVTPTIATAPVIPPATAPVTRKLFVAGLKEGTRSSQVTELQKKLAIYFKQKPDASRVTGYFGPMTKQSLIKFQIARGIITAATAPGAGQVGPKTAAALNQL